jgi:hypothetical protein
MSVISISKMLYARSLIEVIFIILVVYFIIAAGFGVEKAC